VNSSWLGAGPTAADERQLSFASSVVTDSFNTYDIITQNDGQDNQETTVRPLGRCWSGGRPCIHWNVLDGLVLSRALQKKPLVRFFRCV